MPEAVCSTAHPQHGDFTDCAELKNKLVKTDTLHNVGVGVAIAGGLIAAGTVVYALWPKKKSATTGLDVLPLVAPTFAGVLAAGSF